MESNARAQALSVTNTFWPRGERVLPLEPADGGDRDSSLAELFRDSGLLSFAFTTTPPAKASSVWTSFFTLVTRGRLCAGTGGDPVEGRRFDRFPISGVTGGASGCDIAKDAERSSQLPWSSSESRNTPCGAQPSSRVALNTKHAVVSGTQDRPQTSVERCACLCALADALSPHGRNHLLAREPDPLLK